MERIAVVGASLAGLRACETLRTEGFTGDLVLIGDEAHLPYDRPPLSKQVLTGEWDVDRIWLSAEDKLDALNLTRHLGDSATAFDSTERGISLASGVEVQADGVVIATGARPRTIGPPLAGVHTLRTLEDANAIRAALLDEPSNVVVIGAGFIGAEVASSARSLDLNVTMIEMAEAPFERSLGADMGHVLADVHRAQGVDVRLGVGCQALVGDDAVQAVELTDGSTIPADLVVVGVGVQPNTEWLESSGLTIDNGVLCDETTLAAPNVVAAGDVARWPNPQFEGDLMRVEHWDNAITQGVHAAKRLFHGESVGAYAPVPWFWSDQYDRKIQLAGRTTGFDTFEIVTGEIGDKFAGIYGRNGTIVAVVGFNRPRHVMRYRQLIESKTAWSDALAADI